MICTFYRPSKVNTREFQNIVGKLRYDLNLLSSENVAEREVRNYVYSLCGYAKPLVKENGMLFIGLDEPDNMPTDARVEFFYKPTYIATAFIMKALILYPNLLNENVSNRIRSFSKSLTIKQTLSSLMLACTGRNFESGGVFPLSECIKTFEEADVETFIDKYPDICPQFCTLYKERKAFCKSGAVDFREGWYLS